MGPFTLDAMVADDGHNALVSTFCTPSTPFFELSLSGHRAWIFPPSELVGLVLKFVLNVSRIVMHFSCCTLLPERASAYWFRYLQHFRRVERYAVGSDLFRLQGGSGFVRTAKINEPWLIVALNM